MSRNQHRREFDGFEEYGRYTKDGRRSVNRLIYFPPNGLDVWEPVAPSQAQTVSGAPPERPMFRIRGGFMTFDLS